MRGRQHPHCRTGIVLELSLIESLRHPAMRQQDRLALAMRSQKIRIIDINADGDDSDCRRDEFKFSAQRRNPREKRTC
jgi:hypothetical protein